ncbi:hypothetical protein [Nocardia huaxiensis]|uniref:hypothetical protein n=1 Tax=Nocardia huaxiensis TaxID=2755382 RepID=UPI001E3CC93A|nr:hypothetical protein [Nocardia huaxiensis]UFS99708.1 hypothetical protein LPY97_18415 [Nocardia huaxiensis]
MYRIIVDPAVDEQLDALPYDALLAYVEVLNTIEVAPWNGPPQHAANPGGAVRRWPFGSGQAGQVVYLVLEIQREVHVLMVQWFG